MRHNPGWQEVPLAEIDLKDQLFGIPTPANLAPLTASLKEVGLLAPPWLRRQTGGRWQVVTGRKRLLAAAQCGWRQVPARILSPETPDSFCLLLVVHDNAFTRRFNPLEQAHLAARALTHWDREAVQQKVLPLLGLPPTAGFLARLLAATELPEPLQQLVAQERLALSAAARLAEWPPEDQEAARPYLNRLPLSQSQQEGFLETLELLARREGTTPAAILARAELRQYLKDTGSPPRQLAAALRRQLKEWLQPRLKAAEDAFGTLLSRLGLSRQSRLRLTPPPAFEGPDFHLDLRFRDAAELRELLNELARLTGQEDFARLTSL